MSLFHKVTVLGKKKLSECKLLLTKEDEVVAVTV